MSNTKYATAIGVYTDNGTDNGLHCWSVGIPITGDDLIDKKAAIEALSLEYGVPERVMLAYNGEKCPDILEDFNVDVDEEGNPT